MKHIHLKLAEKEIVYVQCKSCRHWWRPYGCHFKDAPNNRPVKDCEEHTK